MRHDDEQQPARPQGRVAPGTHPLELQRLALQEAAHPGGEPLEVQTVIWLVRACNAVMNAQSELLRPLGLSWSAFNVLMALANTPERTLEPCELAERLLVSRPSITGLLDTLEGKGLIRRSPHRRDGRRVLVTLTDAGRGVLDRHLPDHYRCQRELLAALDEDDLAQFVTLLRRVKGATPARLQPVTLQAEAV